MEEKTKLRKATIDRCCDEFKLLCSFMRQNDEEWEEMSEKHWLDGYNKAIDDLRDDEIDNLRNNLIKYFNMEISHIPRCSESVQGK